MKIYAKGGLLAMLLFFVPLAAYADLKPVEGEVVAVEGDDLKIRTASGVRTIMLAKETVYQRRDSKAPIKGVAAGDQVTIDITKVEGAAIAETITVENGAARKPQ